MRHLNESQPFSGVYAAALTPVNEDLRCHTQELENHCQDLIRRGCRGVVLFGTTGEGTSFSVDERANILKQVIELGVDPQKIILGISCCATEDVIKLISVAMDLGCAAVLVAPPFFFKHVDDAGVIAFYRQIIQSVDRSALRLLLYHIPQFSGVPITLNIIRVLQQEFPDSVIGIKESEGNLSFTKQILSEFSDFKLFVGNELQIAVAVQLGAAGGISGIANAYPELITSLYDGGDQERVQRIVESLTKYPIFSAIKSVVTSQKGAAWHFVRPPLVPLDETQRQALLATLKLNDAFNMG